MALNNVGGISSICITKLKTKNKMTKLVENNPQGAENIADDRVLGTVICEHENCKRKATVSNQQYFGGKWYCTYHANKATKEGRRKRKNGSR